MASADPKELLDILNDSWGQDRYSKSSTIKELLNGLNMPSRVKEIQDMFKFIDDSGKKHMDEDVVKIDGEEEEIIGTFNYSSQAPSDSVSNISNIVAELKKELENIDTEVAKSRESAEIITEKINEINSSLDSSGDSDLTGDDGGNFNSGSGNFGGEDSNYDSQDMSNFGGGYGTGENASGSYDSNNDSYGKDYIPVNYEKYDSSKYKTSLSDSNSHKSIVPSRVGGSVSKAADKFTSSISKTTDYKPTNYNSIDYTKNSKYFDDDDNKNSSGYASYVGVGSYGHGNAIDDTKTAIQNVSNDVVVNTLESPTTEYASIPNTGANHNIVTKQMKKERRHIRDN